MGDGKMVGQTAFTRIPTGAHFMASARVNATIAPFDVA